MSLINQMLRDLDNRHALEQDKGVLPDTVRPSGHAGAGGKTGGLAKLKAHKGMLVFAGVAALAYLGLQQLPNKTGTPVQTPDAATALPPMPGVSPAPAPIALQPALSLSEPEAVANATELEAAKPVATEAASASAEVQKSAPPPRLRATASLGPSLRVAGTPVAPAKIDRQPTELDVDARIQRQYLDALVLMNKGQVREAMQSLYAIVRERPGHDASWQILVRLLLEQQRSGEAMQLLSEIAAARPGYLPVVMQLARLQAEYNSDAVAMRTLLANRPTAGGDADYLGFVATLAQRQKQYAQAASEYRQALSLRPAEGRWWIGLGLAEEAQGRQAEAANAWRRALNAGQIDADLRQFAARKLAEN